MRGSAVWKEPLIFADGEGRKYQRLEINENAANATPRSARDDISTVAPFDVANDDWDDDSVSGRAGGDGVSMRRIGWNQHKSMEGVERDKRGGIIRECGIAGCQYNSGDTGRMK